MTKNVAPPVLIITGPTPEQVDWINANCQDIMVMTSIQGEKQFLLGDAVDQGLYTITWGDRNTQFMPWLRAIGL